MGVRKCRVRRLLSDYVIACNGLRKKISRMKVVEGSESRPHKAVSFVVEREKEMQEWNEQKLPKVLQGYIGGRLPGRSATERGGEEEEDDENSKEKKEYGMKSHKKCARRCQIDRAKDSRAKCQTKLVLFANRRRRGGRG